MIRVITTDDHYLVREDTRQLLEASGEADVLATVEDGRQLGDAVDPCGRMLSWSISGCHPCIRWRVSRRRATSGPSTPLRGVQEQPALSSRVRSSRVACATERGGGPFRE